METNEVLERLEAFHRGQECHPSAHCDICDAAREIRTLRQEVDLKGARLDTALDDLENLRKVRQLERETATDMLKELGAGTFTLVQHVRALEQAGNKLVEVMKSGSDSGWDEAVDNWNNLFHEF